MVLQGHDAFDTYLLLLEIRVPECADTPLPLCLPLTTHRCDLHWLYQLQGNSLVRHETGRAVREVTLGPQQHRQVYSPQLWTILETAPEENGRYLLACIVVKKGWIGRHPQVYPHELQQLIRFLRARETRCLTSKPYPITGYMYARLQTLFQLPQLPPMDLDAAIYAPVASLVREGREKEISRFGLVAQLHDHVLSQLRQPVPVIYTVQQLADAFKLSPQYIWKVHKQETGESLQAFLRTSRLDEAARRLREGHRIKDVITLLEFADAASFNHQFRKQFGVPPSQYPSDFDK